MHIGSLNNINEQHYYETRDTVYSMASDRQTEWTQWHWVELGGQWYHAQDQIWLAAVILRMESALPLSARVTYNSRPRPTFLALCSFTQKSHFPRNWKSVRCCVASRGPSYVNRVISRRHSTRSLDGDLHEKSKERPGSQTSCYKFTKKGQQNYTELKRVKTEKMSQCSIRPTVVRN